MINRSALMPVELQSAQVLGKRQASVAMRYARLSRAFTLTELLVVIAITTILLGLLFVPIIQGFNITRRAAAETAAQAAVRTHLALSLLHPPRSMGQRLPGTKKTKKQ